MAPDPVISSIIDRYEHGAPVTAEEKAILHKWLRHALHCKNAPFFATRYRQADSISFMRKKVRFWKNVVTVIIIAIVIFMLYMLGKPIK